MANFMRTRSAIAFDFENPTEDMVNMLDIATALAYTTRFNGHTGTTYSVAEHSVLVSRKCSEGNRMIGLLHDVAEAYTGDIVTPLKKMLSGFSEIEDRIHSVICSKLEVNSVIPKEVKEVDMRMFVTERLHFFPNSPRDWSSKIKPYTDVEILALPPVKAQELFAWEFLYLRQAMVRAV